METYSSYKKQRASESPLFFYSKWYTNEKIWIAEVLLKVRRFARIILYTISMYLVTHLIVLFYLFSICTFRIIINPESSIRIKKQITGLLFGIIGKRLIVRGLENIDPDAELEIIIHEPIDYSEVKKLDNSGLIKLTMETITVDYSP